MLDKIPLYRILKTGFVNFTRHLGLSTMATTVLVVTLVILSVLAILFGITKYSVSSIQEKVDISVYFKTGLTENKITEIRNQLGQDTRIRHIVYTTPEQVKQRFIEKNKKNQDLIDSLNDLPENPFPATLNIQANNLEDYPAIAEELQSPVYKDSIVKANFEDNREIIQKLQKILNSVVTLGTGLAVVFLLIAILVVFNTITLTIYNRREEVEIMRLVGATDWYIRGPFLAEGFIYSLISSAVTALLLAPIFSRILPRIATYVNPEVNIFNQNLFNYWYLVLGIFAISIILTTFSTMLAMRRYLKI